MTDNIVDLKLIRSKKHNEKKLEKIKENIAELEEVKRTLHTTIISLTKYDKYSSVRRRIDDIFILHEDIKRTIDQRKEVLKRLENEI